MIVSASYHADREGTREEVLLCSQKIAEANEEVLLCNQKIAEAKERALYRSYYNRQVKRWVELKLWEEQEAERRGKPLDPGRPDAPTSYDRIGAVPKWHSPESVIPRQKGDYHGSMSSIWTELCEEGWAVTVSFTLVGVDLGGADHTRRNMLSSS